MSSILVSVVVPVYNCSQFIKQSIESVLAQTLSDLEIIILDDCSTDKTIEHIPKDSRINIIQNNKKKGSGNLRNEGIKIAKGKYIAFLDGDDFYPDRDSLRKLVNIADNKNLDIVGGSLLILNQQNGEINYNFPAQYFRNSGLIDYKDYQHDGGFYRFIYRREFLIRNKIEFPSFQRMQDPVFFVEAMIKSKKFYAIADYVYAYRKFHKNVIWNSNLVSDKLNAIYLILKISKNNKLNHLHFLMVKNFINFSFNHLKDLRNFKNQLNFFLLIYNEIDFKLLEEGWPFDKISFLRLKLVGVLVKSFLFLNRETK